MNARKYRTERLGIFTGETWVATEEESLQKRLDRHVLLATIGLYVILAVCVAIAVTLVILGKAGVL